MPHNADTRLPDPMAAAYRSEMRDMWREGVGRMELSLIAAASVVILIVGALFFAIWGIA